VRLWEVSFAFASVAVSSASSKSVHKAPVRLTGATFPAFYPWASRAVEIENTTGRNFEELEGMLGNAKATVRIDYFSNAVAG
jgi:hypothetical protein